MRCSISIYALLLSGLLAFAQDHGGGVVVDSRTGEGVPGAVLVFEDSAGKMLGYAVTDAEGNYSVKDPSWRKAVMSVTHIAYEKQMIPPESDWSRIRLVPVENIIKESKVTTNIVRVRSDTISYNAAALMDKSDRTLGDLLKKLPGISVGENGVVSYQGRTISKMYVDGKDVLEEDYNLLTNNLDPMYVSEIDVLERHQPIKALKNIEESDRAALNIRLKKNRKFKLVFSAQAAAGYSSGGQDIPYSGSGMIMNLGRRFQTIEHFVADNTGTFPARTLSSEGSGKQYELSRFNALGTTQAPLDDVHSLFNRTLALSSINRAALSDSLYLGFKLRTYDEKLESTLEYFSSYYSRDDENLHEINYSERSKNKDRELVADLRIKSNRSRAYLSDVLTFGYNGNDAGGFARGYMWRDQQGNSDNLDLYNAFTYIKPLRGNDLRIENYTQYSRLNGLYRTMSEDSVLSLDQSTSGEVFLNNLRFTFEKKIAKGIFLASESNANVRYRVFGSAAYLPDESVTESYSVSNDLDFFTMNAGESIGLRYVSRRISAGLNFDGGIRYLKYSASGNDISAWAAVSSYASVKLGHSWSIHPALTFKYAEPDDRYLYSGLIFSDYYTANTGFSGMNALSNGYAKMEINYRDAVTSWYVNAKGTFQYTRVNQMSRRFSGPYVISSFTSDTSPYFKENFSLNVSKGFLAVRTKLTAETGLSMLQSEMLQDGQRTSFASASPYVTFDATASITKYVKVGYKGFLNYAFYKTAGNWSDSHNCRLSQNAYITVFPADPFYFGVSAEHCLDYSGAGSRASSFILDAFAWYNVNHSISVYLNASNILDDRTYYYSGHSPLMDYRQVWAIRPFSILAGIKFRL